MERYRLTETERYFVGVHEAAHAICYLLFDLPLREASVVAEPGSLGRVVAKVETEPATPRMHLILGFEPADRERDHAQIIATLAGEAAEELAKAEAGIFHTGYPPETGDRKRARELAELSSESLQESIALSEWLKERTKKIVANLWFRRLQDAIVHQLLDDDDLTRAEIVELLRPIAADILDISPRTWRGRFRLRLARIVRPFRRGIRRVTRRYRWFRKRHDD